MPLLVVCLERLLFFRNNFAIRCKSLMAFSAKPGFSALPTSAQLKQRDGSMETRKEREVKVDVKNKQKSFLFWQMCMFVENWISDIACQIHSIDFPFFFHHSLFTLTRLLSSFSILFSLHLHFHELFHDIEHFARATFFSLPLALARKKNGYGKLNWFQYFMSIFKMVCNFFSFSMYLLKRQSTINY